MNSNMVEAVLIMAIQKKCSDIYIDEHKRGSLRLKRTTHINVCDKEFTRDDILAFFLKYAESSYKAIEEMLNSKTAVDIDIPVEFMSRRFRVNVCKSSSGITSAFRLLESTVPEFSKLNIPVGLRKIETLKDGLVLIVGGTGSGKTMTIASILEEINRTQRKSILTVEDPIEYKYTEQLSRIIQRELGKDTVSYASALRSALRSALDIISVGEMRDLDTIQAAIQASETGHLVVSTLHSNSCTDTPDRIIDAFPPLQQQQIRVQLAEVLKMIVHQELYLTQKGTMVPIVEILVIDTLMRAGLKDMSKWKPSSISDAMRARKEVGHLHRLDNIIWHLKEGRLSNEDIPRLLTKSEIEVIKTQIR